jgi:hypothetical protein
MRRWNVRQCRSVQSIIGAAQNRHSLKWLISSDFTGISRIVAHVTEINRVASTRIGANLSRQV